jgi:hypothetical protein
MSKPQQEEMVQEVIRQKPILIPNPHRNNPKLRLWTAKGKEAGCHVAEQLNRYPWIVLNSTAKSSVAVIKLINGCEVNIRHASTLPRHFKNNAVVPSPDEMPTQDSRQPLYVLTLNNLARLNKI